MTLTVKGMWERNALEVVNDSQIHSVMKHNFLANQGTEAITAEKDLILKDTTHLDVADYISELITTSTSTSIITGEDSNSYVMSGSIDGYSVLVFVSRGTQSRNASMYGDIDNQIIGFVVNRINIAITGHRKAIKKIFHHLTETFHEIQISIVKWYFRSQHDVSCKEIFLDPITTKLHHEFYPYFNKNPNQLIKDYLKSNQTILLMSGTPGTGKTSFIRHMICDHNLGAEVIYDETIMNNDMIFQQFLFGRSQVMIIEDADHILAPRESTSNSLMARFLNVSDGIIQLPHKKLIFTTNISDFGKVDPALLRAGRCFGILRTKELTYQESIKAAEVAGLDMPQINKSYTLAELFNPEGGSVVRKTGF